jgi:TatA/E family protein of Tat protein translocase
MLGTQDLIIALVLGAFFFGAKRLPEIARSLGKSMQEFKRGVAGETEEESKPPSPPSAVTAPAARTCPSCQTPLEADWKVCPRCGTSPESGSAPGPPRSS